MRVVGLRALRAIAPISTNDTPATGVITPYNASSGGLSVTLPMLSLCNVDANLMIAKDTLDPSLNAITFTCAGSDTFDDGTTSVVLGSPGETRTLQVVEIATVKYWKVIQTSLNTSGAAAGTPMMSVFNRNQILGNTTLEPSVNFTAVDSLKIPSTYTLKIPATSSLRIFAKTPPGSTGTTAPSMVFNVKDPAYGATGDGSTDDAPAIQAAINAAQVGGSAGGGVVYFPPGYYRLGSTLLVKESNVTLAGASTGSVKLLITSAAATYPAITFSGHLDGVAATLSNNATYAWNFAVRDLWIEKATPVANATAAISTSGIQMARLDNVHIRGFGTGVQCTASFNVFANRVHIQSNSAATISSLYGWKFDSDNANFSCYLSHCTVSFGGENIDPGAGAVVTSYAYYNSGAHPSDWFLDHCEAHTCTYGYYYSGATAAAWTDVLDIHFVECVADQCQYGFRIADNLTASTTGGQVDIDSCYWANRYTTVTPTPNSYGIAISNSSGVTVRGFQAFSGNPSSPTNYQNNYGVIVDNNSRDVSISGVNLKGNAVAGIYLLNSSYVTVFGNTILQTLSIGANGMLLSNADQVSIVGNTVRSVSGLGTPMANAINVDASSTGVTIANNIVDTATVTTPLTVASGGEAVADNNVGIPNRGVPGIMATANQTADTSFTTTATAITGVSVTWTAIPTRKYRTTITNMSVYSTVANDRLDFYITNAAGTRFSPIVGVLIPAASAIAGVSTLSVVESGLSGSTTRQLRGVRGVGTGTGHVFYDGTFMSTITTEDIGPA